MVLEASRFAARQPGHSPFSGFPQTLNEQTQFGEMTSLRTTPDKSMAPGDTRSLLNAHFASSVFWAVEIGKNKVRGFSVIERNP